MMKVQHRSEYVADNGISLPTVCVLCTHNCGLKVDVKDNEITRVVPDQDTPHTEGYSCNKAYSVGHYAKHRQRVQTPLKRMDNGEYSVISWDQAIQEIAQKLNQLRHNHGANSIAVNGVGGQANHLGGFYALGFMGLIGTKQLFNAYAQEKTQHHLIDDLMVKADPCDMFDADNLYSDFLIIIGTNPLITNRGEKATDTIKKIKSDPDRSFAVIDPRFTETAKRADLHIQHCPGTDAYLLMAMVKFIIDNQWQDKVFVRNSTSQYQELCKLFDVVDPAIMAERCEVPEGDLLDLTRRFVEADKAAIMADLGTEHIVHSTLVSWLVRVLCAITGNYGKKGGNIYFSAFSPVWGPMIDKEKVYSPVSGCEGIVAHQPFAMFSPFLLPEEIEAGNIKALIVDGSNPLVTFGDSSRFKKAFESLELSVVIEPAMTESARSADYVLPTPVGYEKWEWAIFPKGYPGIYGHLRQPVVQGPEQALPEAEIYSRLLSAMGLIKKPPFILRKLAERSQKSKTLLSLLLVCTAFFRALGKPKRILGHTVFLAYHTMSIKGRELIPSPSVAALWVSTLFFVLTRRDTVLRVLPKSFRFVSPFSLANKLFAMILDNPSGVELARLDESKLKDYCIKTKDKRIRLLPKEILASFSQALAGHKLTTDDYPYLFCAGARTQWTANNIHRSPDWRKGKGPHFYLQMHTDLAKKLGIKELDMVELSTPQGTLRAPAKLDKKIHRNMIAAPNGFGSAYPNAETGELEVIGQNVNEVVSLDLRDPLTGVPYVKNQPCNIVKVADEKETVKKARKTATA